MNMIIIRTKKIDRERERALFTYIGYLNVFNLLLYFQHNENMAEAETETQKLKYEITSFMCCRC